MTLEENFRTTWAELSRLGRDPDSGGYHRFAWTPVDLAMREWFRRQAKRRRLDVEVDRNGNLWAWWGKPAAGALVTGSHLDSVPGGGAYDGPLGIVSGFLALDVLRAIGVRPDRPIAVVAFSDEEGARFGVACVGSRLMTGELDPDQARALRDRDGVTLADAVQAAGVDPAGLGRDDEALGRVRTFIELHIEQGRGLVDRGSPVGVGSAIWPHGRWRCRFQGEGNHAGTTRLADRRDPMLPFADTVLAARDLAQQAGAVATFGKVLVEPGGVNAIPSRVDAWLDARARDEATVRKLVDGITEAAQREGEAHGVTVDVTEESYTPVVHFSHVLRHRITRALGGVPALATGAGHDAGILSRYVPSAMLFVRNPSGVSHSPAEHAERSDCVAAVRALAAVLKDQARR